MGCPGLVGAAPVAIVFGARANTPGPQLDEIRGVVRAAVSASAGMTHRGRPVVPSLTTISPEAVGRDRPALVGKMLIHLQPNRSRSGQAAGMALAKEPSARCTAGLGGTSARPSASARRAPLASSTQAAGSGSRRSTSVSLRKRMDGKVLPGRTRLVAATSPPKGESLGKYEFPRLSTTRTEAPVDALTEVSA